ncbi:MAG: WecB/TagA/CpsF family glycosyltransferase [Candidatus Omnitrophica bacterium]|nr:WecB/TagA/CpsF family glycosyltransferase [Candidatus Omnitrophota bacterium]
MKNQTFKVFGLNYNNVTLDDAVATMEEFIKERRPRAVFTTGAELVARAHKDKELKKIYASADMLTVDSHVVYFACRLLGKSLKEPVSAAKLMFRFLEKTQNTGYRLFFLGAKEEILEKAISNLKGKHPNLNIVGRHHGYFDFSQDYDIIKKINEARPDVLFVAMSSPLKERFISKNLSRLNVPVSFGVGGTIDIAAGYCKFAPKWVSKIGFEWFYRFLQEPKRLWKRYATTNLIFIWVVLREIFGYEKNSTS